MGIHKVRGSVEPVQLLTVLPPGLEARGHFYPPLNTLQQYTPGYFNAPGASAAPLQPPKKQPRQDNLSFCYSPGPSAVCDLPPVVMVFCAIDNYQSMLTANRAAAEQLLQQYSDVVRWTLLVAGGYECQEQEGNYMIAFASAAAAVEWALLVQEALMEVNWSKQCGQQLLDIIIEMLVLDLPGAGQVLSAMQGAIQVPQFRGPRARIGIYRGVPTRITPHSATGRADYFGQLVNRAARYCHTAAHGGQVVASRELIDELVSEVCQTNIANLPQGKGPPWTLHADIEAEDLTSSWTHVPALGHPASSCHSSVTGHISECGGRGETLASSKASPAEHSAAAPADAIMAAHSYRYRKHSTGSSTHQPTYLGRNSGAGGQFPTGRIGSHASAASAPAVHSPKAPASARPSILIGVSGAALIPDVSALLILRRENGASSATNSTAEGGRKDAVLHNAKQLHAAALDIDYGLASGLYARLMLNKWKWAEMLLVNDLGQFTFKGISGSHSLVAISTKALGGRQFPHNLRKAKGERLVKGKGLLYKVHMQPGTPERMCSSGQVSQLP
eukprot:gene12684-12814_t